jgi:hypothetical protein
MILLGNTLPAAMLELPERMGIAHVRNGLTAFFTLTRVAAERFDRFSTKRYGKAVPGEVLESER